MGCFIGLDIGTTGAKAVLVDFNGRVVASALSEYPLYSPYPLWSEQDPADWREGAFTAVRQVMQASGTDSHEVDGIGLTGQMHGSVFLDADGKVIRPALLWNDQRTAAECEEISRKVGTQRLIELAGNPALTGFQAPKILWLRNHEPENYARVAQVLLPKDYIRLLLTGESASDASDAAGTLLLSLKTRDYSQEILQALEIPRAWLPRVLEGPQVSGYLSAQAARELGLRAGIPVAAGGGDNAAAAVGTGIVRAGVLSSSIGTSGVIFAHSDQPVFDPGGRLHTFCHAVPGKYHLMAVTLSAGGSLRWWRDTLLSAMQQYGRSTTLELDYAQLTRAAESIPPGAEGLIFLPYLTGERTPHLDPLARGAFIGLTSRHTIAHMTRAVMEGVTFSLRDGLEIMRGLGLEIGQIRATGGGARSALWRQMQADIYQAEVVSLAAEEGPAYGAALLAAVGAGAFADVESGVERWVAVTAATQVNQAAAERYQQVYEIYRALYPQIRGSLHRLMN